MVKYIVVNNSGAVIRITETEDRAIETAISCAKIGSCPPYEVYAVGDRIGSARRPSESWFTRDV